MLRQMRQRLSKSFSYPPELAWILEAGLLGVFFIQALRFLVGSLYARIASASQYPALDPALIDPTLPGLVDPATVSSEVSFLVYALALSLVALIAGRFRGLLVMAVVLTAAGRTLMIAETSISATVGAGLTIGGGLLYVALLAHHRMRSLPYFFVFGIAADQLFRAAGNTLDPSWSPDYMGIQIALAITAVALSIITVLQAGRQRAMDIPTSQPGLLTFWGGVGMGGLLFLELSLLALPNAILGRSGAGYPAYPIIVPALVAATLLPVVPWVRGRARALIGLLDSGARGWFWMLLIALLIVVGTRLQALATIALLVIAQFCVSLIWWWLARPQAARERNLSGLWVIVGMLLFGVLIVFDNFTFEYAFVRDFAPPYDVLNPFIPPLLRGFRGLGLAVILLAVFFATLPIVRTQRRIPWLGAGHAATTSAALALVFGAGAIGFIAAQPPVVAGQVNELRIGTYNIHSGYNEFYHFDMPAIARTIRQSGASIVLLQEIEAGRLSSFGVDQPLWLARELGMDVRFFPTNEGLQGLAVLSRYPIGFDDGQLLTSVGTQTGLQRVQMLPGPGEPAITIYNTWLGVLLAGEDIAAQEADQRQQLDEIFAILATQTTGDQLFRSRTVLGGTFNNVPDSPLIRQITQLGGNPSLFTDPFAGLPPDFSDTYWRTGQRARLDYLFITNGFVGISAQAIDTRASDHRMAVIGVTFR